MSRKRFIKLLMSYGVSRNEAVKIAADYNRRNISYERAYEKYKNLMAVRLFSKRMSSTFGVLGRILTGTSWW